MDMKKGNIVKDKVMWVPPTKGLPAKHFVVYDTSKNEVRDFYGGWHAKKDCVLVKTGDHRKKVNFI